MVFLWDVTLFHMVLGHPRNYSAQHWVKCFDYSECNALKASEDKWKEGKEFPKCFRYMRVWSIQNPLGCLLIL